MRLRRSAIQSYALLGWTLGCMFPIIATGLDLTLQAAAVSWSSVVAVQAAQPLHWIIDLAPLVLMGVFSMVGVRYQQALNVSHSLSEQTVQLDLAIRDAAAHAQLVEQLHAEKQQLLADHAQRELAAERARFSDTLRAVALPVLAIDAASLVIPLIGTFDTERVRQLATTALQGAEQQRCSTVILDCTGVFAVEPDAALQFPQIIDMLALLGARTILSGVTPTLASALVATGLELPHARTAPDLAAAISMLGVAVS